MILLYKPMLFFLILFGILKKNYFNTHKNVAIGTNKFEDNSIQIIKYDMVIDILRSIRWISYLKSSIISFALWAQWML